MGTMQTSTARRRWFHSRAWAFAIPLIVAATLAGLAHTAEQPAAAGDPDVIVDELVTGVGPGNTIETAPISYLPNGRIVDSEAEVGSSCFEQADGNRVCVGDDVDDDYLSSFDVQSTNERWEDDVEAAFGWIAEEARVSLAGRYQIPDDGRIPQYLRGEIRAYVIARVTSIFDKVVVGEQLTDQEAVTLAFVEEQRIPAEHHAAQWALDEYNLWKFQGCAYSPPTAPAAITSPVTMPNDVVVWCNRARSRLEVSLEHAPPMPTASQFRSWGLYRHADENGLALQDSPEYRANYAATTSALLFLGAWTVGVGGGGAIIGIAGVSLAVAKAITIALGVMTKAAIDTALAGGVGFSLVAAKLAAAALLAAGIVVIVVLALIVFIDSVVKLVQAAAVGTELARAAAATGAVTDPFGIRALAAEHDGRTLDETRADWEEDPGTLPGYRSPAMLQRMFDEVTRWMTTTRAGEVIPDPVGVWPDNATDGDDLRWREVVGTGSTVVDQITVLRSDGTPQTVRFDRGWFIVTPQGGQPYGTTSFDYQDPTGASVLAMRAGEGDGFVLAEDGDDGIESIEAGLLQYRAPGGGNRTANLVFPEPDPVLGEVHPAVAGALLPSRTHTLFPNPVDEAGDWGAPELVDDYDYAWTLRRFDPTAAGGAGAWVAGPTLASEAFEGNATYSARFTPTVLGDYEATVTATPDGGGDPTVGVVRFSVASPTPAFTNVDLVEDAADGTVRVDAQVAEPVPSDTVTLHVQWPGVVGSEEPGPTTEVEIVCNNTAPATCSTIDTALEPELAEDLTHALADDSDLRQDVVVTAASAHGGEVVQVLGIDDAAWPTFAEADEPSEPLPGVVDFAGDVVELHLPVEVPGAGSSYDVARLVPGDGATTAQLQLLDPETLAPVQAFQPEGGSAQATVSLTDSPVGSNTNWVLSFGDVPTAHDLGSYSVPIIVQEVGGGRATIELQVDVVPAHEDRFRGGLLSDVDPLDIGVDELPTIVPMVFGGRTGETYQGDLCVSLEQAPAEPEVLCADAATYTQDVAGNRLFPWATLAPGGLDAGPWTASAWVPDGERTDENPIEVDFVLSEDVGAETTFMDVSMGHPFWEDVEWLYASGIANGFEPGPQFRPAAPVSRQAMAAFLYRMAGSPSFADPASSTFADVGASHPFFTEVEWLADTGISTGTPGTPKPRYKPSDPVSRQAMAAFLYRLAGEPTFTPPASSTFGDVGTGHPFFNEVEWLAAEEISTGTPASPKPRYKPSTAVSRGAMAAFLHRLDAGPGVDPALLG
jgi:hypothetical protein